MFIKDWTGLIMCYYQKRDWYYMSRYEFENKRNNHGGNQPIWLKECKDYFMTEGNDLGKWMIKLIKINNILS